MSALADRYGGKSNGRRLTSAGLTVGVHLLALALLLLPATRSPADGKTNLVAFDVTTPGPSAPPAAKKPLPRPVPEIPVPLIPSPALEMPIVSEMVQSMLEQADIQAAGGSCDLTPPVQAALRTNPEVQLRLPDIPAARRSVANALVIWNTDWAMPDDLLDEATLEAVRSSVITTIEAASDVCRFQPQGGPRLIYLPADTTTTVLVVGSGEWTWQQVAQSARPEVFLARASSPLVPGSTNAIELGRMADNAEGQRSGSEY